MSTDPAADDDETAEPSRPLPPTESFRQVDAMAPTVAGDFESPLAAGNATAPSSPPAVSAFGSAPSQGSPSNTAVPTVRVDAGTMLSVRAEGDEGALDTPRRSGQVMSSPRSTRDYRVDELEEQVRALDARVRLLSKTLDRAGRLVALGLGILLLLVAAARWL